MSLTLYLQKHCDHCDHTEELWSGDITHNLADMALACGLYKVLWRPDENGFDSAGFMIDNIEFGIENLRTFPVAYEEMNPENGWGDYDNLLNFAIDCLAACKKYPDASVVADR